MSVKRTCASVAVLLLITAVFASGAAQDEVVRAEKAWAAALLKGDAQALDRLLAPDLIFTHANGVVEDKGVLLGNIRSGALRYQVVAHEGITVKPYDGAAVLHCRIRLGGRRGRQAVQRVRRHDAPVDQGTRRVEAGRASCDAGSVSGC